MGKTNRYKVEQIQQNKHFNLILLYFIQMSATNVILGKINFHAQNSTRNSDMLYKLQ